MEFSRGPRRLVFSNLAQENKPPLRAISAPLLPGNIRIHSSSVPGLLHGVSYTAQFTQAITYPDINNKQAPTNLTPLVSSKDFTVEGNPYFLDSSLIDSVYPPPGHSDYSNVLPHVLFNDLQAPWSIQMPDYKGMPQPWIGLLLFTEDELTLLDTASKPQVTTINATLTKDLKSLRTPTLAYNLTIKDLSDLGSSSASGVASPVQATDTAPIQAIFLQGSTFAGLFSTYTIPSAQPKAGTYPADVSRYTYMSSVRTFNASGLANKNNEPEVKVSATVSPRTAPLEITQPTTVYAHLVSLPGVAENMQTDTSKVAALVSLYSWSYTCLPPTSFALEQCFDALARNIQPLRIPDSLLNIHKNSASTSDDWVRNKLLAGYNLIRYRVPTGEVIPALHRGLLTPIKTPQVEFPPSDSGTDLAIVDEATGFLDLTYQMAWSLGRTLATSDRTFSAALMRLRTNVHNESLADAKKQLDASLKLGFVDMPTTVSQLVDLFKSITSRTVASAVTSVAQRWQKDALGTSTRNTLSFVNAAAQNKYKAVLQTGISSFANAIQNNKNLQARSVHAQAVDPIEIYNETNSPLSTDYAALLAWLMDRWFLQGLPMINLIPDPAYVPKESIRTFFIDQSWFRVLADGVLSISDHFNEDDDVREGIKASLDTYLATDLKNMNYPPQIPKWGFFLRSEAVTKFPDLRISAPRADNDPRAEVLRMETIDTDLLVVLFDREPGNGEFPEGISLQPPEHQLSSMFGEIGGIVDKSLIQKWTKVYHDVTLPGRTTGPYDNPPTPTNFNFSDPIKMNGVFDYANRSICPEGLAAAAEAAMKWDGNPASNIPDTGPGILGSQLLARVPRLVFAEPSLQLQVTPRLSNRLSTSKTRGNIATAITPPSNVSTTMNLLASTLPIYNPPANPLHKALGKVDLDVRADQDIVRAVFSPTPLPPPINFPPLVAQAANRNVGDSSRPPYLSTQVFNLRVPYQHVIQIDDRVDEVVPIVITPAPLSLGFTSDIHVSNISLTSSSRKVTSIDVIFSVGQTAGSAIFAPFAYNPSTSSLPKTNSVGMWPAQTSFSGYLVPVVRVTSLGHRWLVKTAYSPPASSSAVGTFTITIYANLGQPNVVNPAQGPGSWDIGVYNDSSFVIQDVLLNEWNQTSTLPVIVNENYIDESGTVVQAKGQVSVIGRKQDVTQSFMSFPPLANTYTKGPGPLVP